MITLGELRVADTPDAWRDIGFEVADDVCTVGGVRIRLAEPGTGITAWALHELPASVADVDGIPTSVATDGRAELSVHRNGVTRIDHLVLMTPDVPRTVAALASLGLEVRRDRDAGAFHQVFFRLGAEILEVVGPKQASPGSASLWGITFVVDDIAAAAQFLGDRVGRVKDAVQPGRRITTLRGREVGVSPAIAFISA